MKRQRGFTLIELLIVIAIIAILVAILVPTFLKVKESARQGTAMENMKLIGQGLAQYKLENRHPPQVLFGYVDTNAPTGTGTIASPKLKVSPGASPYGLYPSYVKTADTFKDPDNPADDATVTAVGANSYYAADAYDLNPQVMAASTLSTSTPVVRYSPTWEPLTSTDANAGRQLQAVNPPGDTYVTCTTYHVPGADKVLVLFENGSVKKMTGADFAVVDANNGFWTVKP